jgi:hypothetical protein
LPKTPPNVMRNLIQTLNNLDEVQVGLNPNRSALGYITDKLQRAKDTLDISEREKQLMYRKKSAIHHQLTSIRIFF